MSQQNSLRRWLTLARRPDIVSRSVKVGLFVGTILALINHGERLLNVDLDAGTSFKIALTYLVPYSVSTWSAVQTAINAER